MSLQAVGRDSLAAGMCVCVAHQLMCNLESSALYQLCHTDIMLYASLLDSTAHYEASEIYQCLPAQDQWHCSLSEINSSI